MAPAERGEGITQSFLGEKEQRGGICSLYMWERGTRVRVPGVQTATMIRRGQFYVRKKQQKCLLSLAKRMKRIKQTNSKQVNPPQISVRDERCIPETRHQWRTRKEEDT